MTHSSEYDLPLAVLREMVAASDLLPNPYERYRPLLADGLVFFLRRLPPARLRRILAEQSAKPLSTPVAERMLALLHHIPTLHKLGQVLARDRRLHPDFRARLQELETLEPRTPRSAIVRALDREFPRWRSAGITLAAHPLAEGSVAMVIPFTTNRCSHNNPGRDGVFKLLKPGIERRLAEDLEIWSSLGKFLDEDCERYHLPGLDYQETFETVRDLLVHEIKLDEEQAHLAEAAREYAGWDRVLVPALFPFCTPRLTAMEHLPGEPLTHALARPGAVGERLAPIIAEALVARPVFSAVGDALFHADPHAGNLLVTPAGRLGILDWSLAGRLRKADRIDLVQLLLGALTLDAGRMEAVVLRLSRQPPAGSALARVINRSLRELRWGRFPGVAWLTRLLDGVVLQAGARLRPNFLLFRKSLLTLEGVLADLTPPDSPDSSLHLDGAMLAGFARQFAAEWPERLVHRPDSRALHTHLSSTDLLGLLWSFPTTLARFWTGAWKDAMRKAEG